MSDLALQTLLKKREQLQSERMEYLKKSGEEVRGIDMAIKAITGKYPSDLAIESKYDDESPTYIKGTEDGI
jgi:hypothetical protein